MNEKVEGKQYFSGDSLYLTGLVHSFHQHGIYFKALDLGIDTTTPVGKFMLSIFASLAEYDRESILEKSKAGQQLAAAQGKHIGRPKGLDAENLAKVKKALEKGLSVFLLNVNYGLHNE